MSIKQTRNPDKWTIKDFVYLTKDEKTAEQTLWKYCMENEDNLRSLCHELGWNGGTIHQVLAEIMKKKDELNTETQEKVKSGNMKKITHTFSLE